MKPVTEMLMFMLFAAVVVIIASWVGPGIFNFGSNHLPSFPLSTISDHSITASDAVSYYLQALLAVVFGFLALKYKGEDGK